jgi:hypothetical protein
MRLLLYLTVLCAWPWVSNGQCLTDFSKLVPEPSLDVTQQHGRISMFDNYLAIGFPANDSLGRLAGVVRIYERMADGWKSIATLAPSDPQDGFQFGSAVALSENYLLVAGGSRAKKVYLFKKPLGGWESQTELTSFVVTNARLFGTPYQIHKTMAISEDEQTLAITDPFYFETGQDWSGAVFVYHKQIDDEWNAAIAPVMIFAPEDDASDFGRAGVSIKGDRVITGTPMAPTANGRLYVYRDPTGEFLNLQLEAKLSAYGPDKTAWLGYSNFVVTSEGIFVPITLGWNTSDPQNVLAFYEAPSSGDWHDADYTCAFPYHPDAITTNSFATVATNGSDIIVSSHEMTGNKKGYTTLIKKGSSGWCEPELELVDISDYQPGQLQINYGYVNAMNSGEDIAVGLVPHPDLPGSNVALKCLSKEASGMWKHEVLSSDRKSSAGHNYGRAILGFEDYVFVGASGDASVKPNGGAVYVYKKSGEEWSRTGKIKAPANDQYDDGFGTALATNGNQLAVGAAGFGEHGRVFIYEKNNDDWTDPLLKQEIELPENILTVFAYGDNVAMNDEWLLIPYIQNNPARMMLAAYKYNGVEWVFNQVTEIGLTLSRSGTMAVAIENQTVVVGGIILELDFQGVWRRMYFLSTSDPEPIQIAPDFSHWITNGSSFGHSVAISNNTIFIGAPTKDDGGTWDVGAIYVYTKRPWESWSNRTESAKILPRVRSESELFGYSIKVLGNTLIAGAPGSDFTKSGEARNKPGRAYIFQTEDYFWQTVTPLIDLTGDSFVKDYFGFAVNLDETDFFISAPIEDLESGKLSGSVYVTPAPPIVKLVAPMCSSTETIELFGYPLGGIWSGPGLLDTTTGMFDPKAVGIGEHEFTYTTPSCSYQGKLRIKVEEAVSAALLVNQEHFVCQQSSVQIPLAVQAVNGYQYLWYHRDDNLEPFFPLNQRQSTMTATLRGEYKVKVYNAACESFSSAITIKNDSLEMTLDPIERICSDAPEGITLTATPSGGQWSGLSVTADGKLFTSPLGNGIYNLTYKYTSSRQCLYQKSIQYVLDRLQIPSIEKLGGDLCSNGAVSLRIKSPENDVAYSWLKKNNANDTFEAINEGSQDIAVNERGVYRVEANDGKCLTVSNQITVEETSFPLEMLPANQSFVICAEDPFSLSIKNNSGGKKFEWYFAETEDNAGILLQGQEENSLSVVKTGYYYAVVTSGICTQESPRKHVTVKPNGDIFIPNIFTPNGDSFNDFFEIQSNFDIVGYRIMNRYGGTVFTAGPDNKWTGEGSSAGVYYWLVTYRTCSGEIRTLKGPIHLMK